MILSLHVALPVCLCLSACLCISLSICLSMSLSVCLFASVSFIRFQYFYHLLCPSLFLSVSVSFSLIRLQASYHWLSLCPCPCLCFSIFSALFQTVILYRRYFCCIKYLICSILPFDISKLQSNQRAQIVSSHGHVQFYTSIQRYTPCRNSLMMQTF